MMIGKYAGPAGRPVEVEGETDAALTAAAVGGAVGGAMLGTALAGYFALPEFAGSLGALGVMVGSAVAALAAAVATRPRECPAATTSLPVGLTAHE